MEINGPRLVLENADIRRIQRQEKAMAIVKAIRPVGHPEHPDAASYRPPPRLPHTELPGNDPDAPGVVYFLYSAGFIKIGYTTDIKQRLGDFHTHSPMPVTLLLTIRGWPDDEEGYHFQFDADRARREWFRPSLDLREFLSCSFECGSQELMHNAEEEARELFEASQEYWKQLEIEMQDDFPASPPATGNLVGDHQEKARVS